MLKGRRGTGRTTVVDSVAVYTAQALPPKRITHSFTRFFPPFFMAQDSHLKCIFEATMQWGFRILCACRRPVSAAGTLQSLGMRHRPPRNPVQKSRSQQRAPKPKTVTEGWAGICLAQAEAWGMGGGYFFTNFFRLLFWFVPHPLLSL